MNRFLTFHSCCSYALKQKYPVIRYICSPCLNKMFTTKHKKCRYHIVLYNGFVCHALNKIGTFSLLKILLLIQGSTMTKMIKEEHVTSSYILTIPSSSTIYFFCCHNSCFSLFPSLDICTIDISDLFWCPVSALILCSSSFPCYYPLFSVGKKD